MLLNWMKSEMLRDVLCLATSLQIPLTFEQQVSWGYWYRCQIQIPTTDLSELIIGSLQPSKCLTGSSWEGSDKYGDLFSSWYLLALRHSTLACLHL